MKSYLEKGGSILVLLGEGGEVHFGTNINFLLEDFGIMVNCGEDIRLVSVILIIISCDHHFNL